jgi:hypothetical protein
LFVVVEGVILILSRWNECVASVWLSAKRKIAGQVRRLKLLSIVMLGG